MREGDYTHQFSHLTPTPARGEVGIRYQFVACPACGEFEVVVSLYEAVWKTNYWGMGAVIEHQRLKPASRARPLGKYVPAGIVADYTEACLIETLSPKASATLSRRAVQQIARDFFGIVAKKLIDEINQLEAHLPSDTWRAVKKLVEVANLGAHPQEDINVIIDVGAEEAAALIRLVELLIEETYDRRADRQKRLAEVQAIADRKQEARKEAKGAKEKP